MLIPYTEKWKSSKSPWQVFQSLAYQQENAFFLDSICYQPPDQKYSYLGVNPFLTVTLEAGRVHLKGEIQKSYPANTCEKVLRDLFKRYQVSKKFQQPYFMGGAVGFLSYEMAAHFETIRFKRKRGNKVPLFLFGFYRDIVVYSHREEQYFLISHYEQKESKPANQRARELAQKRVAALKAILEAQSPPEIPTDSFSLKTFQPEISKNKFLKMVNRVKAYIRAGDVYQANLSQRFKFSFQGSAFSLYGALRKINPSPFSSFFKSGDLVIVSSSPERLVNKAGSHCETRPIAGTYRRTEQKLNFDSVEESLLKNEKERAEHIMLVDLERNDMGRVCDYRTIQVEELMTVEKYSHVIHLVSKITGRLSQGKDGWDLLKAMFPGGTITGCPKIRCMQIIDELEPVARGLYTGSLGYFDYFGNLDFNIVIRTLVLEKNKGSLQVGAGIVYDSDPEREYAETLHKGDALMHALAEPKTDFLYAP